PRGPSDLIVRAASLAIAVAAATACSTRTATGTTCAATTAARRPEGALPEDASRTPAEDRPDQTGHLQRTRLRDHFVTHPKTGARQVHANLRRRDDPELRKEPVGAARAAPKLGHDAPG